MSTPERNSINDNLTSQDTNLSFEANNSNLGAGDSYFVMDILPEDLANIAFEKPADEVGWDVMHHRGGEVPRLVAIQGEVGEDGSFPIYRHPGDESPPLVLFTPTISLIQHSDKTINHALEQFRLSSCSSCRSI